MDDLDLGQTLRGFTAGQKVFERYTLTRMLGRGGMGVVWLARDEELGAEVALKFLPEILADDRTAVDDLRRETRRARELTHPNIVRIHDFLRDSRLSAISMEYVAGDSLANRRHDQPGKVFSSEALRPWVKQLCEALAYAHAKAKIVHRDLKPANLMVDAGGDLKIADFGISATLSDTTTRVSKQASSSGTPVYMSPQQMMGEKPAATDDVYSLGATLYELLTGKPPFYSGNVLLQVQNKVPPSVAARRAELGVESGEAIPSAWEEMIAACLAKDPAQRPQSAVDVWRRLEGGGVVASRATRTEPPVLESTSSTLSMPPSRSKSRLPLALGLAAVLAVAGWTGWYYGIEEPAQRRLAEQQRQEEARRVELARLEKVRQEAEQARQEQERQAEQKRQAEMARLEAARGEAERARQAAEERAAVAARERDEQARLAAAAARAEQKRQAAEGGARGTVPASLRRDTTSAPTGRAITIPA